MPTLRRPGLKEEVAGHIRELIFDGQLWPGTRIDQDELANSFGISKLPVREALIVLESEGLVETRPHRGTFVANLQPNDIRDSYQVIGLVSSIAARRAVASITDSEIDQLRDICRRMEGLLPEQDHDLHQQFHRTIHRAGGSRKLNKMLKWLTNSIPERLHYNSRQLRPAVHEEHRRILSAIENRDAEQAAAATVEHFSGGAEFAVALLADRGIWDQSEVRVEGQDGR